MGIFSRNPKPQPPSAADIREAGRRLQQGGTDELAEHVVAQAIAAGHNKQDIALQILDAAAHFEPTEN